VAIEGGERNLRGIAGLTLEVGTARQLQQVAVAGFALRQQHQLVRRRLVADAIAAVEGPALLLAGNAELTADDRLQAGVARGERELEGAEEIAGVGHGDGRHGLRLAERDQLLQLDRALRERIGGVDAEMDEIGMRHGRRIPQSRPRVSPRDPREGAATRSVRGDIGLAQDRRFQLRLAEAVLHDVADADDARELAVLDHRHVADAAVHLAMPPDGILGAAGDLVRHDVGGPLLQQGGAMLHQPQTMSLR
jgi:hypothetical protein